MGREKDPIMKYTEKLGNCLKCKFCQAEFRGNVSATRIKAHLAEYSGNGIQICARVTQEAKAEARLAWDARKRSGSTSIPGKKKNESKVY